MTILRGSEAGHRVYLGRLVLLGRRETRRILGVLVIAFVGVLISGVSGAWCATTNLSVKWAFARSDVFIGLVYGSGNLCPPTVFDIDGDGHNEIIWGSRTGDPERMWCISDTGRFEWVFPPIDQEALPGDPRSKVSLVDVDSDGAYELAFAGAGGVLHIIDGDGRLVWKWVNPNDQPTMIGPPQAYDVDGDGHPEFFMNDGWGALHRINHNGDLVWGWKGPQYGSVVYGSLVHPTICDIDQDGDYELLAPSQGGTLYCIDTDNGNTKWSFDTGDRMFLNPVIVADINGDDVYEALVWNENGSVICLDPGGGEVWRWNLPRHGNIRYSQPLGDVDRDGSLDMVIVCDAGIFCIDIGEASPSVKWEVDVSAWSEKGLLPDGAEVNSGTTYHLIADVDGDNELEVLLLVPFPVVIDGATGSLESYYLNEHIAVGRRPENGGWWGDVDDDGISEWICDLKGTDISFRDYLLYCLTANGTYPAESPWPEYYHSSLPPEYQVRQGLSLISAYSNSLWFPLEAYGPGSFFSVSIYTDKDSYTRGQTVTITARVRNASRPVPDAWVHFRVTRPDEYVDGPFAMFDDGTHGDITPGDGVYTAQYPIGEDHPAGDDFVEVNATRNGLAASQRRSFQVLGQAGLGVHNVDTDESFVSIQEALDDPDTVSGHTILVESGTYGERVVVNKAVHLKGLDTGSGKPMIDMSGPIVDVGAGGDILTLVVDGISLEGFEIAGSSGWQYAAIRVESSHNTITQNEVHNNDNAVYLDHSTMNTVADNVFYDNDFHAVYLDHSNRNTIHGNRVERGDDAAFLLENSESNAITYNSIVATWYAIQLVSSSNNTITNNTASQGKTGIDLYASHNNELAGNKVTQNSFDGVTMGESNHNIIRANLIEGNNLTGLSVDSSTGCVFEGNTMSGNLYNFWIGGSSHSHFANLVDESNTVDGKPIHYLVDLSNIVIDASSSAGMVYCINCTNITIRGLALANNGEGILLYNTTDSTIESNLISTNGLGGIALIDCGNITITSNTITDTRYRDGIYLEATHHTTITNNTLTNNNDYGIHLSHSNNNTIKDSAATLNDGGIYIQSSHNNMIAHNTVDSNSDTGIVVSGSYNTVIDNIVTSNTWVGIEVGGSGHNKITQNKIEGSNSGIRIDSYTSYNEVSLNNVSHSKYYGLHLVDADFNTIQGNIVTSTRDTGISLESCMNNLVLNNTVSNNDLGIFLGSSSQFGIISQCNIIQGNNLTGNRRTGTTSAVMGEEEEARCLLGVAELVIKEARGLNTAPYQALLQRGYEEFEKGNFAAASQYAREAITLRYQIWEGSMLGLLLLTPLLALCRGARMNVRTPE